jgi:hypothetical protein
METRFCIEYVNPRHPLRDNGSINVRYDRVLTLEQAEHDLTLILSFGAKILNLYMGNAADGKIGEWNPIPMIVDDDDWFTTDWLNSLNKTEEKFERPVIKIIEDESVSSRIKYIKEDLKPIAEFIMDFASWNLHKDEWNHPVLEVPLFRVLDALIQRGKPYCVRA